MLKDHVIDYNDMIKAGQISDRKNEIPINLPDRKYAVIIKTAKANIGKFDITDAESVKKSIYAIDNNSTLDGILKESAMYHVKQAADYFDIPVNWNVKSSPRIINVKDIEKTATEPVQEFILKIANDTYRLNTVSEIKQAEDMLLSKMERLSPTSMINGSRLIMKAARYKNYKLHEDTVAFARAKLGSKIPNELELRKRAKDNDPKYQQAIDILSNIYSTLKDAPIQKSAEYLQLLQDFDKTANFRPRTHNTSYANILKDDITGAKLNVDKLLKLAKANGDPKLADIIA